MKAPEVRENTSCTNRVRAFTWPKDPAFASPAGRRRRAPCHLVMMSADLCCGRMGCLSLCSLRMQLAGMNKIGQLTLPFDYS